MAIEFSPTCPVAHTPRVASGLRAEDEPLRSTCGTTRSLLALFVCASWLVPNVAQAQRPSSVAPSSTEASVHGHVQKGPPAAIEKSRSLRRVDAYQFENPSLGTLRYTQPRDLGEIWVGVDVRAVAVPQRLGWGERSIWTTDFHSDWAVGLAPWLSAGGRHGLVWFGADEIMTRFAHHQLELVTSPLRWQVHPRRRRLRDRVALGIEFHRLQYLEAEGVGFEIGGARDVILRVGYAMTHQLHRRVDLAWQLQYRHAWVYESQQRQGLVALRTRVAVSPRAQIAAGARVYLVHRDETQRGVIQDRFSPHVQVHLGPAWVLPEGVTVQLEARYAYGLLGGEVPVYEVGNSVITESYADLSVSLSFDWTRLSAHSARTRSAQHSKAPGAVGPTRVMSQHP